MMWMYYLQRICNHCTYPACVAACPREAIYKRPEDGIVLVDQTRCRGYQECLTACPYKKTMFNLETRVSEKCIGCYPKLEQGLQTQCTTSCIGRLRLTNYLSAPGRGRPAQAGRLPRPRPQDRAARSTRSSGSSRTSTTSRPCTSRRST